MLSTTDQLDELCEAIGLNLAPERRAVVISAFRPIAAEIAKLRSLDLTTVPPAVVFSPLPGRPDAPKATR
jgi:hypothetical protein